MTTRKRGFWTKEKLAQAVDILGDHDDMYEALTCISAELQHTITYDMLTSALARDGQGKSLTKYLSSPRIPPANVAFEPPPGKWEDPLTKGKVKTLILPDPHIPLQDDRLIERALKQDGDADQLVVPGDIFDIDQINSFGSERDSVLRREYGTALAYVVEWALMFKRVYLAWGNHEYRITRHLRKAKSPAINFLFRDIVSELANGIQFGDVSGRSTGQIDLPNVFYQPGEAGWWVRVGDAAIAHPRSFYKKEGETARRTFNYFNSRHEGISTAIIGHTHMLYHERKKTKTIDHLIIEAGCLCKQMTYTKEGKLNYEKPAEAGYAVLYQQDGVTDMDKTKYVDLGSD